MTIIVYCFSFLPSRIQQWIYDRSMIGNTTMSFYVEPGSTWLAYPITNDTRIKSMIPPGVELTETSIFPGFPEQKYLLFNYFRVSTPFFQGTRLEVVTVVEEKTTCKKRFLILDYLSDTVSSDPKAVFRRANDKTMSVSSTTDGNIMYTATNFSITFSPNSNVHAVLHPHFYRDANERIYYGTPVSHSPNELDFNQTDVKRVVRIRPSSLVNLLWKSSRTPDPTFCFHYKHGLMFSIIPNGNEKNTAGSQECMYKNKSPLSLLYDM